MKIFLLLFFCLIVFSRVFCQSEYQKGYFINNQGDSSSGYVDIFDKEKCKFKLLPYDNNKLIFYPGDINAFGFENGKKYVSKSIQDKHGDKHLAFVECLVSGKVSLYKIKGLFYVESSDSVLYELEGKNKKVGDFLIDVNKYDSRDFHNKKYIGILRYLLQDCPEMFGEINDLDFYEGALSRLIINYNRCAASPYIQYQSHLPTIAFDVSLFTGLAYSQLDLKTTSFLAFSQRISDFQVINDISWTVGSILYISFPKAIDRFSLTFGAQYFSSSFYLINSDTGPIYTNYYEGDINNQVIKMPVGIQYTIRQNKIAPFFAGGLAYNYLPLNSSIITTERVWDGVVETYENDWLIFQSSFANYWFSAGLQYAFSEKYAGIFEVKFEGPVNVSSSRNIISQYSSISFTIGLLFK